MVGGRFAAILPEHVFEGEAADDLWPWGACHHHERRVHTRGDAGHGRAEVVECGARGELLERLYRKRQRLLRGEAEPREHHQHRHREHDRDDEQARSRGHRRGSAIKGRCMRCSPEDAGLARAVPRECRCRRGTASPGRPGVQQFTSHRRPGGHRRPLTHAHRHRPQPGFRRRVHVLRPGERQIPTGDLEIEHVL